MFVKGNFDTTEHTQLTQAPDATYPTYSIPYEDLFITYKLTYNGTLPEGKTLDQYVSGVWMQNLPASEKVYYLPTNCTDLFPLENVGPQFYS